MYCSYCAAVLDPTQPVCARCGRPVPAASAPSPAVVKGIPSSVRLAGILLLVSIAIGVLSMLNMILAHPGIGAIGISALGFVVWILNILCVIFLWKRQNWARILVVVLIVWSVGNLALSLLRLGGLGILNWSFTVPLAIDALRLCAIYLLFRPESNAWFKQ